MSGDMNQRSGKGGILVIARLSVAGLFGFALATKLIDPQRLLTPFEYGLGLSPLGAGSLFLLTVLALCVCIMLLLMRRGGLGLVLSAAFFVAGVGYSVYLSRHQYQGSCGCGVSVAKGSEHELMIHRTRTRRAPRCVCFLEFGRERPGKVRIMNHKSRTLDMAAGCALLAMVAVAAVAQVGGPDPEPTVPCDRFTAFRFDGEPIVIQDWNCQADMQCIEIIIKDDNGRIIGAAGGCQDPQH